MQPNWIQYQFDKVYKLTEMWVWNSNQMIESFVGFGAKTVTIEYSVDGARGPRWRDVPEFAQAPAAATYTHNTTVNFGGVLAQYVKLTINTSWSGLPQTGLAEVRFFQMPVQARRAAAGFRRDGRGPRRDAELAAGPRSRLAPGVLRHRPEQRGQWHGPGRHGRRPQLQPGLPPVRHHLLLEGR